MYLYSYFRQTERFDFDSRMNYYFVSNNWILLLQVMTYPFVGRSDRQVSKYYDFVMIINQQISKGYDSLAKGQSVNRNVPRQ